MKTTQKECQVVLLPTDNIIPNYQGKDFIYYISRDKSPVTEEIRTKILRSIFGTHLINPHYFYVLSDENIKKGDWVIWFGKDNLPFLKKVIVEREGEWLLSSTYDMWVEKNRPKKIIATTNPDLKRFAGRGDICDLYYNLPKPTDEFIQQWITKGCPEKINVDYELYCNTGNYPNIKKDCNCPCSKEINCGYTLRISDNNIITCSFIEDIKLYTKEDMINASKYGYNYHKTSQFLSQEFEDSCINNTKQWLTIYNPPTKKL